jgi:L-iditol 2-dehydrogenase
MRALVKYAPGVGNVRLMDVEEPACGPGQVKIEVAWCGVCGTDLHVLHDTFRNYPPVILGHEFTGRVVETGAGVERVRLDEMITVLPASARVCGQCCYCRAGYFIFCPIRRGMGHGVNGAFTTYAVVRQDQCYRIPEGIGIDEAAISEPFAAAVQAVEELTPVRLGDVALVSGPGPIGLLCLKLLAAEGIKTIVAGAGTDGARLAAAAKMGAARVVDTGSENLLEIVKDETGGYGVDAAFECSGHADSVRNCLEALRPLGRYTQVGICGKDITLPFDRIFYKQLTVKGSITYTAGTWDRVMRIYEQRRVRLDDMISAKLTLDEWETGFEMCRTRQGLKVLISPAGDQTRRS